MKDRNRQRQTEFAPPAAATSLTCPDEPSAAIVKLITAGFEAGGAAVALFAPDDSLAFLSPSFRALFDIQPSARSFDDVMRHCFTSKKGPAFSGDINAWLATAAEKRRSVAHRAFEIDMKDGRWFWANETSFAGGWLLLTVTEISVLKSNERMISLARDAAQLAADTDALTGLFNRRYAMKALAHAMEAATRDHKALSVALIDLDHFKTINDRFGHFAGDQVLCHFADACRRVLRKKDTFARIGGEEFLLIMPNTKLADAAIGVERLRSHVDTASPCAGIESGYTLSAGVARLDGDTLEKLLQRADRALYRAKSLGRNRIELTDTAADLAPSLES